MKKLLSYVIPVRLKDYHSTINGPLEINLLNGKKVLDTTSVNYSYGSLQRILHRGLSEIRFDSEVNKVLVLGLGGGSVVETIRKDFGSDVLIELVDIDPEIISIAINEFEITRFGNVKLIQADAFHFIKNCLYSFDMIIVDIFIGDTIPTIFTAPPFIHELIKHLTYNGKIIFNTLKRTMPQEVFSSILSEFKAGGLHVKVVEGIESTNSLILASKNKVD